MVKPTRHAPKSSLCSFLSLSLSLSPFSLGKQTPPRPNRPPFHGGGMRVRTVTCRRHGDGATTTALVLFLWVLLILAPATTTLCFQLPPSPRKLVRFSTASFRHAPSSTSPAELLHRRQSSAGAAAAYGDEKRLIHTGPNPLHN